MRQIPVMKVCIAGIGAIGTYLACKLSRTGISLSVLARGERAGAIRANGLSLTSATSGEEILARPQVLEPPLAADHQDWLFICVKAYSVPEIVRSAKPLIGPDTHVVFAQNGLPWWQGARQGARIGGGLDRLDPGGHVAAAIDMDRVVGCVTYSNVANLGLGRAHHVSNDTFLLGRPDGNVTAPLERIGEALRHAGVDARLTPAILREVWLKLWGNLAFNPISALTGATMDRIIGDAATRPVVIGMMREAEQVAERLGVHFEMKIDKRLEAAASAGAFKTSMLQDLEAGRPLEVDAILGAVADVARRVEVKTPTIDVVLGLLTQKIETIGAARRGERA